MGNAPTAVSEFKNRVGHRVDLENRYGSLAAQRIKLSLEGGLVNRATVKPGVQPLDASVNVLDGAGTRFLGDQRLAQTQPALALQQCLKLTTLQAGHQVIDPRQELLLTD